jgi:hypothetical protein
MENSANCAIARINSCSGISSVCVRVLPANKWPERVRKPVRIRVRVRLRDKFIKKLLSIKMCTHAYLCHVRSIAIELKVPLSDE